jgi:hypothetical protein
MCRNKRANVVLRMSLLAIAIVCLLSTLACIQKNYEGFASNQSDSCPICGHYLWSQNPNVSIDFNENGRFRILAQSPGQSTYVADIYGQWVSYDGGWQRFSTYGSEVTDMAEVHVQYMITLMGFKYYAGFAGNQLLFGIPGSSGMNTALVCVRQ